MENITIIKAITGVNDSKAIELNKLSYGDIDIAVNLYMKEIDNIENNNKHKHNVYFENEIGNNPINTMEDININEINDNLEFEIDLKKSLFDNNISKSFKSNLKYMKEKYGMIICQTEGDNRPKALLEFRVLSLSRIQRGKQSSALRIPKTTYTHD